MKNWILIFVLCFCFIQSYAQQKLSLDEYKAAVAQLKKDTLPYLITRLPDEINSPFSEYCPHLYNDSIFFFSSMKSEIDEDNDQIFDWHWSNKIYNCDYVNDNYLNIKSLAKIINKSNYYHPNFCFDQKHEHIIFSRCIRTEYEELVCHLYESHQNKGKWGKPQQLGSAINSANFSSTQPYLAELEDYKVLYFVSNNPKGQGGMDIWFSIYKDGKYGEAINAGSGINTSGNEVCPFYDSEKKTLYFSSDEWIGIGGYDIFKSEGALSSWKTPKNLGIPFNSCENDIYFCINDDKKSGFLSSNRPLSPEHIEDTCCNDIFRWSEINENENEDENYRVLELKPMSFSLYFDNDLPEPRSTSDTSSKKYNDLLSAYAQQKEVYLSKNADAKEKSLLKSFFADSLGQCKQNIDSLFRFLMHNLGKGQTVTLRLEGFASALHNQKYNLHLSKRRIVSFVNEIKAYEGGKFLPYIQNKQLIIIEVPAGSQRAKNKSTNPVYSFGACLDRRIDVNVQLLEMYN